MKKNILLILSLFLLFSGKAQNRIIMNNDGYIVIDNSAKIVIENSNPNAITVQGTGGNIVSESESDELIWLIGNSTGLYSIPWSTRPVLQSGNGVKIPTTMNISTAGSSTGSFVFSTYETTTDMNAPYPTGVTTMNSGSSDGSLATVDRFWKLDNSSYTIKPAAGLSFTYDDNANEIGGSNLITESSLVAQRWNSTLSSWQGLTFGATNATTNITSGIAANSTDFFPIWTLVNGATPLPVELLSQTVISENCRQHISWVVESETDASHYRIEYSSNGETWQEISNVQAQGTTQTQTGYEYLDEDFKTEDLLYYRITQVDLNGQERPFQIMVTKNSCFEQLDFFVYPNPFSGEISVYTSITDDFAVEDMNGKIVCKGSLNKGVNVVDLSNLATGIYNLRTPNSTSIKISKF